MDTSKNAQGKRSGVFPAIGLAAMIGLVAHTFSERSAKDFDPTLALHWLSDANTDTISHLVNADAQACIAGLPRSQDDVTRDLRMVIGKKANSVFVSCGAYSPDEKLQYIFSVSTGSQCDKTEHTYTSHDGKLFQLRHDSSDNCSDSSTPLF